MMRPPPISTLFPYTTLFRSPRWLHGPPGVRTAGAGDVSLLTPQISDACPSAPGSRGDRKSTRLNSSHANISYAVFCLKKKKTKQHHKEKTDIHTMMPLAHDA